MMCLASVMLFARNSIQENVTRENVIVTFINLLRKGAL